MEQTKVNAATKSGLTEYTVIEDCSPYYIRFTFPKLDLVINQFRRQLTDIPVIAPTLSEYPTDEKPRPQKFKPLPLSQASVRYAKAVVPFWNTFEFDVPIFAVSEPGLRFPIHKDSAGVNFMIDVLDEECITSWYTDESVAHLTLKETSTKLKSQMFDMSDDDPRPDPIKTAIFKPMECVLINGDLWHDWNNSNSQNRRINLLCRSSTINPTFEEMRKTLFGY